MLKVKIIPLNQRAKNRVNEHGEIMLMAKEFKNGDFCVFSLDKTFRTTKGMVRWGGWFSKDEAKYEVLGEHETIQEVKAVT